MKIGRNVLIVVVGLWALTPGGLGCGEDHSTLEPDASMPEPKPDASMPEPKPDASMPEPEPDASMPEPEPDASMPELDASIPIDGALASLSLVYADGALTNPLIPALDLATSTYTIEVGLWLAEVQVIATPSDSLASITINGNVVEAGDASDPIPLNLNETSIQIDVTAPDGATRTYTLKVNRAPEVLRQAYAKALDTDPFDHFGYAVSLWGDTLAVGTYMQQINDVGGVYVFTRSGTAWEQQAYLTASNAGALDRFGCAVSLWGDTLAVGAHAEDSAATGVDGNGENNEASSSGAVYVFTRTGTAWEQQAYLKAWKTNANDNFGFAVSLWGDTLAVGAYGEDSAARRVNNFEESNVESESGAVYVFTRTDSGTGMTWSQQAYLKAWNTDSHDNFGFAVSLWGDTLAVGAHQEGSIAPNMSSGGVPQSGAVYVFTRSGTTWSSKQTHLKASNVSYRAHFGHAVSLWGDTLAVGANQESNGASNSGAVYVFTRSGTTWSEKAHLTASNADADDLFGSAIALWGDTLAVSAYQEDSAATDIGGDESDDTAPDSGAVYVFTRTDTTWLPRSYVKASNTGALDYFGYAVSLWGDTLAVGAYQEDSAATGIDGDESDAWSGTDSGAVYLFR